MLRRLSATTLHGAIFWPVALVAVVGIACVLTRPIHELIVGWGWMADDNRDFLRVFRRLLLLPLAAVFLWRLRPWRGGTWHRFGLARPQARWRPPLIGFGLTVLVLAAILVWQFRMGWLVFEEPLRFDKFGRRVATYLVGGIAAGFLEEWFFRGWLCARGTRDVGPRFGVLITAALFGLSHAFRPSTLTVTVSHDAAGALEALRGWLGYMLDPAAFGPAAFGLFCFSLLLSAAYKRSGTLWTAIGIHAGAVLVLFSYGGLTDRVAGPSWAGTRLLYDSPVVWVLALAGACGLWPRPPRKSSESRSGTAG